MITKGKLLEQVQEVRCIEFGDADAAVMVIGNCEDSKAIAALIAAAPELLEACKTCQAAMKAMPRPNPFMGTKLMEELTQAIAKAENK